MKIKKAMAFAASAAIIFALTGCESISKPTSVPTIVISGTSEESGDTSSIESTPAESVSETSSSVSDTSSADTSSVTSSDTTASKPEVTGNNEKGEMSGNILVCNDGRGIVLFGGGTGETYANALNQLAKKVGAGTKVNVFSMIIPTSGSFYMPENFGMASEWDAIQNVNSQLQGIIPVDAYTALSKHTDEEIYARTDHHWMQLGAYYAAEEFVKTAQIDVPFTPISEYERHEIEGYLGTLYGYSNENALMAQHPETFTYYVAPNDFATYYMNPTDTDFTRNSMFVEQPVSCSYSTFMGGDEKVVHVTTDVTNGRKLLIIKDSYPNALVPCLTGSFEEIWTVDMRYLEEMQHFPTSISKIVKDYGITDVLFCMDTFSAVGENANHLAGII